MSRPKLTFGQKLWNAYARLGEHVTWCDQCLDVQWCPKFDKFFNAVLRQLNPADEYKKFPRRPARKPNLRSKAKKEKG